MVVTTHFPSVGREQDLCLCAGQSAGQSIGSFSSFPEQARAAHDKDKDSRFSRPFDDSCTLPSSQKRTSRWFNSLGIKVVVGGRSVPLSRLRHANPPICTSTNGSMEETN